MDINAETLPCLQMSSMSPREILWTVAQVFTVWKQEHTQNGGKGTQADLGGVPTFFTTNKTYLAGLLYISISRYTLQRVRSKHPATLKVSDT